MNQYKNIVIVVADSLRYDTVWGLNQPNLPFLRQHSMNFHQAYSAGCWTLPATASIFTGFLPHEHQATTRTRKGLSNNRKTLAESLSEQRFETVQITANTVTTNIFGLDRGFQRTEKAWQWVDTANIPLLNIVLLSSKRRMRKKIMQGDFIAGKMTEDVKAGQVWFRSLCGRQLDRASEIINKNIQRNQRTFLFINLMETHFPYHVSPKFKAISQETHRKIQEIASMFHLVNQSWLTSGKRYIPPAMLQLLRQRQQIAWKRIAPNIDRFAQDLIQKVPETLFIFLSDHGDNFGDENWWYHFGNVTEAGNRVPLFISTPDCSEKLEIDQAFSTASLYNFILQSTQIPIGQVALNQFFENPPCIQSYWYDMKGKTMPQYQHDQFAFVYDNHRYIKRPDRWVSLEATRFNSASAKEDEFPGNPIFDLNLSVSQKNYLADIFNKFILFSQSIL